MVKFSSTTPLPSTIIGGGYEFFLTPPLSMKFFNDWGGLFFYKYLEPKNKKWIFSATVHLTRRNFIFTGRYLKVTSLKKKLVTGDGPFENAKG